MGYRYGWVQMGTDRYREKKLPDLTNPPSVQIRTNPYCGKQAHWLGHSNGVAGAFLGLIGLMGLIGQRLTEWQTLFLLIFCGAAYAPPRFPLRVSDRSDRSDTQALSERQRS